MSPKNCTTLSRQWTATGTAATCLSHPLSLLIAAVNTLQEKEPPIGLTVCGLPTLRTNLLKARTHTERMRGEEIGRLAEAQAVEAFVRPLAGTGVEGDSGLVSSVVREAEGYPYFIVVGSGDVGRRSRRGRVPSVRVSARFDRGRDLPPTGHRLLRRPRRSAHAGRARSSPCHGSVSVPPLRTTDIHTRVGKREGNVNVLMGRLAEQGVVFRTQKGQYEYTAPKFHEYLRRRIARPRTH